jgi:hypothetical protein
VDAIPANLVSPKHGEHGKTGGALLIWRAAAPDTPCEVIIARDEKFSDVVLSKDYVRGGMLDLESPFDKPGTYYWKVRVPGRGGMVDNEGGPRTLVCEAAAPSAFMRFGANRLLLKAPAENTCDAAYGRLDHATAVKPGKGPREGAPALACDGNGVAVYALPFFPPDDYSFAAWIYAEDLAKRGIQQICSAWCAGMDDPLRVIVQDGKVHARIESGTSMGTSGAELKPKTWTHVAAIKQGDTLKLYVDGSVAGTRKVPAHVATQSTVLGLGGNPLYTGDNESFRGSIASAHFWARALSDEDVQALAKR